MIAPLLPSRQRALVVQPQVTLAAERFQIGQVIRRPSIAHWLQVVNLQSARQPTAPLAAALVAPERLEAHPLPRATVVGCRVGGPHRPPIHDRPGSVNHRGGNVSH